MISWFKRLWRRLRPLPPPPEPPPMRYVIIGTRQAALDEIRRRELPLNRFMWIGGTAMKDRYRGMSRERTRIIRVYGIHLNGGEEVYQEMLWAGYLLDENQLPGTGHPF